MQEPICDGAKGKIQDWPFENHILYKMCVDHPYHADPRVTAGKLIAIGRIYAASPERGAGKPQEAETLFLKIGERLNLSSIDVDLCSIGGAGPLTDGCVFTDVIKLHTLLVEEIKAATKKWSSSINNPASWPRANRSFASKYLHFHCRDAFPIMDKFAIAGLRCSGFKGSYATYEQFYTKIMEFAKAKDKPWTLRSIDSELVEIGRKHELRSCNCSLRKGQIARI